jgi:protein-tyrosine-phosphatase
MTSGSHLIVKWTLPVLLLGAGWALSAEAPQDALAEIGKRCWADVRILADDAMEGRQTGSPAHRRAAAYVADQFRDANLSPGTDGGFIQPVKLRVREIVEEKSSLALIRGDHTRPLSLGADAIIGLRGNYAPATEAPLVFAGYGLKLPRFGFDDLADLDLKGKVVVAILAAPARVPGAAGAHFGSAAERWKVYAAAGAIGVVFIPNPFTMDLPWERIARTRIEPFMVLADPAHDEFRGQRVWVQLNPDRLHLLLEGTDQRAEDILAKLKAGEALPRFPLPSRIRARIEVKVSETVSENVVGVLRGSDPRLQNERVVVSAHLDHLGIGREGDGDRLFNGAMDNASGVAVLMQTARDLQAQKVRPRRSIVFVAVTAEEKGLLGSRAFVLDSARRGDRIVANLNTDMFLPLYPLKHLVVFGLEESELGEEARAVAASLQIRVQPDPEPLRNRFIRSDQYSFIRAGIPALAMKVGFEADSAEAEIERKWFAERYHAPSDAPDQPVDLTAVGMYEEVVRRLAIRIADRSQPPHWHESSVFAGAAPATAPIVMICEHGSVKSLMAASFFNQESAARNLPFRAIARGITPDATVPGAIASALGHDGFEVSSFTPQRASAADLAHAPRIVAIGVDLAPLKPTASAPIEKWNDVPAASLDYASARAALKQHVNVMLDELESR